MELMARNEQLVQLPCLALKQEEEEEEEDVEEPGLPQSVNASSNLWYLALSPSHSSSR